MKPKNLTRLVACLLALATGPFAKSCYAQKASVKGEYRFEPNADIIPELAPKVANRPLEIDVEVTEMGSDGVLFAQGGQLHGWSLFMQQGKLCFSLNRENEHNEVWSNAPSIADGKSIRATLDRDSLAKIFVDGHELASRSFNGLIPSHPIDGLQVGRDLQAAVGKYKTPFEFSGKIKSALIKLGEYVEPVAKPFVGSVTSGGIIPHMEVTEQTTHPFPGRDRFGGFVGIQREATGFFRVETVNGRWCFVTPDGHPYIALGPNHTGPTIRNQGQQIGLWDNFGGDADMTAAGLLKTIHQLGFTAGDVYQPESTYTKTLPWISFYWYGSQNQTFVDVFDRQPMERVRSRVLAHAKSAADNPWILGLGGPDLQIWDSKLVRQYRELPPESAGRQRYVEFLRDRYAGNIKRLNEVYRAGFQSLEELGSLPKLRFPSDDEDDQIDAWTLRWKLTVPPEKSSNPAMQADNDAFCGLVAETLFPMLRQACKEGAPNHLFMGEHLAVRMIPDSVIQVMGKYVDVYLAQAVEVSPQRPPEWQVFQKDRWDHEYDVLKKPIVIVDWGAVFSLGEPFDYRGAVIKSEKEASDEAAKFITDAFESDYVIGLFLCKLLGDHRNDENFFQKRATRTYLRNDGSPYPYRTDRLREANFAAQNEFLKRLTH